MLPGIEQRKDAVMLDHEFPPELRNALQAMGFGEVPDCDVSFAFQAPTLALDTGISVAGDHADDLVYLYFSCPEAANGERLCGYFHAPSLLEYLPLEFGGKFSVERLLREVNRVCGGEVRLVQVHGYSMLYVEAKTAEWLAWGYSDILKCVGQMDYFLTRAWRRLMAERQRGE